MCERTVVNCHAGEKGCWMRSGQAHAVWLSNQLKIVHFLLKPINCNQNGILSRHAHSVMLCNHRYTLEYNTM